MRYGPLNSFFQDKETERINYQCRVTQWDSGWVSHPGLSKYKVHALTACVANNNCVASGFSGKCVKWSRSNMNTSAMGLTAGEE